MIGKINSGVKKGLGFAPPLVAVGFVLLVSLAIAMKVGLAARTAQTAGQLQQTESGAISPTSVPDDALTDTTKEWKQYELNEFGLSISFPADFLLNEVSSIKPSGAISAFLITPEEYEGFLAHQAPKLILTIYDNPKSSLLDWFMEHATQKRFDDPTVSMKDSPYYFREYTAPQIVNFAGQEGIGFSARTINGETEHVLLNTPDQAYILDWRANENIVPGDTTTTLKMILHTLNWLR